jgi:hypothetical protein
MIGSVKFLVILMYFLSVNTVKFGNSTFFLGLYRGMLDQGYSSLENYFLTKT